MQKCRGVNLNGLRPGIFVSVLVPRLFCVGFLYTTLSVSRHLDGPGPREMKKY